MKTKQHIALAGMVLGLGLALVCTSAAQTVKPPKEETLSQRLAKRTKLSEDDVNKVLRELGPAIQEDLKKGKTVALTGLGTFRVVRVAAHKDMERGTGRLQNIAANNTVEFLASGDLGEVANAVTTQPAETVPPFEYNTLPGQTPGQKVGRTRVPPGRQP